MHFMIDTALHVLASVLIHVLFGLCAMNSLYTINVFEMSQLKLLGNTVNVAMNPISKSWEGHAFPLEYYIASSSYAGQLLPHTTQLSCSA